MASNSRSTSIVPGKGFPQTNYGVLWKNAHEPETRRHAMIIPRMKYTFVAEFQLNPVWMEHPEYHQTNLLEMMRKNKNTLLAPLISITRPSPRYQTTTLNAYNRKYPVVTKEEPVSTSLTFYDDSASIVAALLKEHRAFYTYDEANYTSTSLNLDGAASRVFGSSLLSNVQRADQGATPNRGMRLRETGMTTFFEQINIYDLGGDPDSVNVDVLSFPSISSINRDGGVYNDTSNPPNVTLEFTAASYTTLVGKSTAEFADFISSVLGAYPWVKAPSSGHAR